jgi:hypothetical protein
MSVLGKLRGLIDSFRGTFRTALAALGGARFQVWVDGLRLLGGAGQRWEKISNVVTSPRLTGLASLVVIAYSIGDVGAQALARSPYLTRLTPATALDGAEARPFARACRLLLGCSNFSSNLRILL